MNLQKYTEKVYNKYGSKYHESRIKKDRSRIYNEEIEMPSLIRALGNIKRKKLLDLGCGTGIHIRKFVKKGASCEGVDLSKTMIDIAKKENPDIKFKVGNSLKLPYQKNQFDIVVSSLTVHYITDLYKAFKEVSRVLKKGGKFYFTTESIHLSARQTLETNKFIVKGYAILIDKKTKKQYVVGDARQNKLLTWNMLPEMKIKSYRRPFEIYLRAIVNNTMEFIDYLPCKPTKKFKKIEPKEYEQWLKIPLFGIYIARKK